MSVQETARETTNTGRGRPNFAPPFRRAKVQALARASDDSKVLDQARKKSFSSHKQDAVATNPTKATNLPHRPAISTGVHTSPHGDQLIHNFGTRTGAKERHHRQRHWPRALVRIIMARKRCPHNTAISKSRSHRLGSRHDWWRCDGPIP